MTSYRKNVYLATVDFKEMFGHCYDCLVVSDCSDHIQKISDPLSFSQGCDKYLSLQAEMANLAFKKFSSFAGTKNSISKCEISSDLFYDERDLETVTYASQRITVDDIPYFIPS
jgi:hypothetical protein